LSAYDKRKSRQSFDRAAHRYDKSAALQQQVATKLIELLSMTNPQSILDIGCGTGQVTEAMCAHYPQADVVALDFSERMLLETEKRLAVTDKTAKLVCADAENLPFVEATFELMISSLMLQWSNDLTQNLMHMNHCLTDKGQLAFSTFTEGTLKEVKASWRSVDGEVHTSDFMDVGTLRESVEAAGFHNVQIHQETIVSIYPNVREILMDMKRIGASNAHSDRSKGLTGKQRFAAFEAAYEAFKQSDLEYPCTWELAYVFGEK
jgi:malonyl-CoA O-methyltransferase